LNFEIKRQTKLWEKNEIPDCDSTRGWDDERGETLFLRKKESQDDYRYFPEPDLPPIEFSKKEIEEISETLPELPIEKFFRYKNVFKISELDALKLSDSPELAAFFEKVVEISDDPKKSANLILSVILSHENWQNSKITPEHAADVVQFLKNGAVSSSGGKQLLESAMESGGKIENLIAELGLEQVSDSDEIENWIAQVLKKNPETVAQFQSGKEKVLGFLVGQVMKLSRGSANPEVLQQMLLEKLKIKN